MSRKNGNNNSVDLDIGTLSGHLWEAANILRGPVDAADFKTYIFPLLFFKRLSDVYDEEYAVALEESDGDVEFAQFPENHRFQVPEGCHWKDVRAKSANIGHALQKAMRCIEQANPDTLHGIFGDAQWTNKDRLPDRMLRELIEHFSSQTLSLSNCPEDDLGVGYEFLIKKFADDSGHTAAEFYTNLTEDHIQRIVAAYQAFGDEDGFARVVGNDEIREKGSNLSIPLYVRAEKAAAGRVAEDQSPYGKTDLKQAIANWQESSMALRESLNGLFEVLEKGLSADGRRLKTDSENLRESTKSEDSIGRTAQ